MKNIVLLIFSFALLVSCHKDMQKGHPAPIHPEPLFLSDKIKSMIPKEYRTATYTVFKNTTNEYKYLNIKYLEHQRVHIYDNEKYNSESIYVQLTDSIDNRYYISVSASAAYSNKTKSYQYINVTLTSAINDGLIPLISISENGKANFGSLVTSHDLLDQRFINVYEDSIPTNSFSEVFYTFKEGVIGFRDINNELWVLDRIE